MKIYLSGKITGFDGYRQYFAMYEHALKRARHTVINPAKAGYVIGGGARYEDFMHVDFALIDIADAVLALPTWRQSKGARREIAYAKEKGKRIFYSHAGFHELTKKSMK